MEYKLKSQTNIVADTFPPVMASDTEARLHYILNVLECIDQRTARELARLDGSGAEEDLKDFVRQDILARAQELKLPLQEAAEELRAQYRASSSDEEPALALPSHMH
jgi:hypothetical protein